MNKGGNEFLMTSGKVCAVVVTFRPGPADLDHLVRIRPQVEDLVVVDNGSAGAAIEQLRALSEALCFTLIENRENLGIGAALNVGVRCAESHNSEFVVLFDQDSCVTENFVRHMVADFAAAASRRNIGLLVPRYVDPESGLERMFGTASDGGPLVTITSGSFFKTRVFEECGDFREELFIYAVDDEYSLRLRSRGYSIAQSSTAILLHASGHPMPYCVWGKKIASTSNHSAGARYYLNRNRIWMLRNYGLKFPKWTCWALIGSIKDPCMILLAEKQRWQKLTMMLRGTWDGVLMRMGKTVEM